MTETASNMISIYRGDYVELELVITDETDAPVNIADWTIKFSVKKKEIDTAYLFQKTTANQNEIRILDQETETGKARVYILPADTNDKAPGTYVYDVEVTIPSNKPQTLIKDIFQILADITRD